MSKRSRQKISTEITTATVTQLSHEGRGIAHINGKTTFIFGALLGETVQFRYSRCHAQFDEGAIESVIEKSVERVEPPCKHFGICGGCSLQHLSPAAQRAHKETILLEHLQHQAHCQPAEILPPLVSKTTGYRRRARLSVKFVAKKNKVLVGFRERQSSFVAEIAQCETLHPSIGDNITAISELLSRLAMKSYIPQLEIAIGDNATAVIVRHMIALPNCDQEKLIAFAKEKVWHLYFQPKGCDSIHAIYPANPEPLFYDIPAEQIKLSFQPAQFTQINQAINVQMIARAIELLNLKKTDIVLDLFCGIGNFSLPMAKHCARVVGIEGSDTAIFQAKKNALNNDISNVEFYIYDLAADLQQASFTKKQYDKILLDPPRVGAQELLPYIQHWKPERIVYVSCNLITLARDTKHLLQLGYRLEKAGVMDMFPHTEHVEAIALFVSEHHEKCTPIAASKTLDGAS